MTQPTERRFVMEPRLDAEVQALEAADATKVAKAGDTMTGALTLNADPTNNLHAATKQYVDAGDAALQTSINDVKQTSRVYVKNGASSLTKGTPVYITGADGTNVIIGAASNASEATSSKVIGLTETDLTANQMGYVVTDGKLSNIDTSGAGAAGDAVWLGVNGAKLYGLANKPVAPAHMVYLGVVSRKNANTGEIEVKVQNGFELNEIHDVLINAGTLATGQALTYDASTSLWKNATPVSTLAGLSDVTITSGTLAGGQVIKYDAGTTKWVNGAAAGGVTAAATAPNLATSAAGDAWFDTNDGTLYVCYVDTDSTKQWVQVQANSALEASILSRLGALESQSVAFGALSPNYIINGGMDIWQRGTSTSTAGFLADRWQSQAVGGSSYTQSRQSLDAGVSQATTSGEFYYRHQHTAGSGVGDYALILTRVEDVRTLANQTISFSFWATADTSRNLSVEFSQYFGTGGSSTVNSIGVTKVAVTTSVTRYTVTATLPSVSGKTIGAGSFLEILIWFDAGSNFNSRTNSLGHQSGAYTFNIWGVQLERGSTATAFRRNAPSIQAELAACQRYYKRWTAFDAGYIIIGAGTSVSTSVCQFDIHNQMRIGPTSVEVSNAQIYRLAGIAVTATASLYAPTQTNTVVRFTGSAGSFTSTPENVIIYATSAGGYIALSAEL